MAGQPSGARFHVFAPDRRGHGRIPDVDGPITQELMAQDTVAFIETVVGEPAHLVGCSDGTTVALLAAPRRPDLVRRLVLCCGVFHHDGWIPGAIDLDADATAFSSATARSLRTAPSTSRSWRPSFIGCTSMSRP